MNYRLTLLYLTFSFSAYAQLNLIETNEIRLVTYDFGHQYVLPHAGRCFHNALEFHKKLFDYTPSEKITILIQDFGDYGNGGATAVPKNAVSIGLAPFSYAFETSPAGERIFSMANHELIHVLALDNATKTDRFYHKLFFGKVMPTKENPISMFYSFLTSPRRYSPRWFHEGIASYIETWMSGGVGLAVGSYDEMVFRTRVLENARIYTALGLESEGTTTDFQGRSNSYLYGTRFMGYLSYEYGPEKIIEWVKRNDGSKRTFSAQFKQVFGKPLATSWDEWIEFEKEWQRVNAEQLRENPITDVKPITERNLGSVSYAFHNEKRNEVYVAVNYPGQVPHLATINLNTGKLDKLVDIKGAALFYVTSLTFDPEAEILYYTTDNDNWRDLNSYNVETGKTKLLQKDVRTGDLAFNHVDKSIWGIKHLNGYSTITKIPRKNELEENTRPYSGWKQIYTLPYGKDIFDIDISPDGRKMSAAVADTRGNQLLLIFDLMKLEQGEVSADTVFNFDITSPQSFRYTKDGKYLYGTSYWSGVSNIYRVETESLEIAPVTNAVTGFFRPLLINDEQLFAFEFRSDGFQPVYIKNELVENINTVNYLGTKTIAKHPMLKDWETHPPRPSEMNFDEMKIEEGQYRAGKLLKVNYAYPTVVGYKDFVGLGYLLNIGDPFGFRELEFEFAYTPRSFRNGLTESDSLNSILSDEELYHFSAYAKLGRFEMYGSFNGTDFYDLFGPTKTTRKGIQFGVDYLTTLIYDPPRNLDLNLGISTFYGLEKSPEFQTINTTASDNNFFVNLRGGLTYRYMTNSLGAVDPEKGIRVSLRPAAAYSAGSIYPRAILSLDYGIQMPVNHFSIWIRTAAGKAFSNTLNPFTRFGFAAFGNNYIDHQTSRRYRTEFSFPGVQYDADVTIIAKEFAKGMIEFVLPPIRYRELGFLNFYANWTQLSIFTSGLRADNNQQFVNFGAQLDTRLVLFSLMPSTLSLGYASAFDLVTENNYNEWMISLKILR
ncbi:MAG TPA: hypothetical protein VGA21_15530 [Cyclobacteriaceae bacterium]|jgi:hypothetical protein